MGRGVFLGKNSGACIYVALLSGTLVFDFWENHLLSFTLLSAEAALEAFLCVGAALVWLWDGKGVELLCTHHPVQQKCVLGVPVN